MKVFFLPRWFPVPHDPFWGSFVLNHARCLKPMAEVFVVYVDGLKDASLCQKHFFAEVDGVPVLYCFYHKSSLPFMGKFINTLRMVCSWRRAWSIAVKQWGKPDVNHVHVLTRMGVMAAVIKKVYRIPFVITEHWSRYLPQNFYYTGLFRQLLTRWVVKSAGAVMPVSFHLQQAMVNLGLDNHNYAVVPNVVDTDLFTPLDSQPKPNEFTFVHVSTFDNRAKNISGLLHVVERLARERNDFVLRMIGDGVDYELIKDLADKLQIARSQVVFTGALASKAVAREIAQADMLLLFSNYENQPVVILEALSCGIPVLATRVGGIPEVIHNANGYLVDPGDEEGLMGMMRQVLDLDKLPFSKTEIREAAIARFSSEQVGRKIEGVYQHVLKHHPHA